MVEVKAKADSSRGGCGVNISFEGEGLEILEEALAVVQGVMGSLKEESKALHMLAIKAMADDPKILCGEDWEDGRFSFEGVKHIKFKEGVN